MESGVQLPGLFAYAREHDPRQCPRCCTADTLQLTAGDDIESTTDITKQLEKRK